MASGGNIYSNGYQGNSLYFEWGTNSINSSTNVRNIWYKISSSGGSSSYYYYHNDNVSINGVEVYRGGSSHTVYQGDVLAEGSLNINQNNTSTLTVSMHGGIYVNSDNIDTEASWTLDTIPRYLTINTFEIQSRTVNSVVVKWATSDARDATYYSLNGGSWVGSATHGETVASNSKSGTFNIKNLTPNTRYSLKIRIKRTDSQLWTESRVIYFTTYQIAQITNINDINHGDNQTFTITNPSNASMSLSGIINNTTILQKTPVVGNNTIQFTQQELDNIYKLYGNNNSVIMQYILTTSANSKTYTQNNSITITLTGNQKTTNIKVNNNWKRGKSFVKVNNEWKSSVMWIKVNNNWKRCV